MYLRPATALPRQLTTNWSHHRRPVGCGMVARSPADDVEETLARWLGPNTARNAVRVFSERSLKKPPGALTAADLPELLRALQPMLRTLVGTEQSNEILAQLERRIGP